MAAFDVTFSLQVEYVSSNADAGRSLQRNVNDYRYNAITHFLVNTLSYLKILRPPILVKVFLHFRATGNCSIWSS